MRLKRLTLKNFGCFDSFTIEPNGNDISIFGNNAAGKTTIFNAYTWLLFGKSSENSTKFDVKPIRNGEFVHNVETSVTGVFEIDGEEVTLERVYYEKYQQKRGGSSGKEFTGHTTDYFIREVPKSEKEFNAYVESLCPIERFAMLSDPMFVNTRMDWKVRRGGLIKLIGGVDDARVFQLEESLAPLQSKIGKITVEEFMKVRQSDRTRINDELDKIPTRIDEANLSKQVVPERPKKSVAEYDREIAEKEAEKASAGSSEAIAALRAEKANLVMLRTEIIASNRKAVEERDARKSAALSELRKLESAAAKEVHESSTEIADAESQIEKNLAEIKVIGDRFTSTNASVFQSSPGQSCPKCGYDPTAEERAAAEAKFNLEKSNSLEELTAKGKTLEASIADARKKVETMKAYHAELVSKHDAAKRAVAEKQAEPDDIIDLEGTGEIDQQIADIDAKINDSNSDNASIIAEIESKIAILRKERSEHSVADAVETSNAKAVARVAELEEDEKRLGAEFEDAQADVILCEKFIRTRASFINNAVDGRFTITKWKLFNELHNGGLEECCIAMVNDVPFESLNHAARLNCGLDIINAFTEYFKFAPPVFIDQAESVTSIIETKSQQVRLVVSENDKTLRID